MVDPNRPDRSRRRIAMAPDIKKGAPSARIVIAQIGPVSVGLTAMAAVAAELVSAVLGVTVFVLALVASIAITAIDMRGHLARIACSGSIHRPAGGVSLCGRKHPVPLPDL